MNITYIVEDEYGTYGEYTDRMEAVIACNKLNGLNITPVLSEVHWKELSWEADYKELCKVDCMKESSKYHWKLTTVNPFFVIDGEYQINGMEIL